MNNLKTHMKHYCILYDQKNKKSYQLMSFLRKLASSPGIPSCIIKLVIKKNE